MALENRETYDLIGSDKVEGTAVYRSNGDKIGHIARVMIGKRSGKVGYAVMSFGGFMGIGEDYYPLPWSLLINSVSPGRSMSAAFWSAALSVPTTSAWPVWATVTVRAGRLDPSAE